MHASDEQGARQIRVGAPTKGLKKMALIKCPECEKEISSHALSCPNCGYPLGETAKASDSEECDIPLKFAPKVLDMQPIRGMRIDPRNKTFMCGFLNGVHRFSEITNVEIFENGASVTSAKASSVIGRSIVGSAFNPVGAIIGGVTAKKVTKERIYSMEIFIHTKGPLGALIKLPIPLPGKVFKGTKEYAKAVELANKYIAIINSYR